MANIKVKDLTVNNITGIDLFSDSESFITDLSDKELNITGGRLIYSVYVVVGRAQPRIQYV